MAFWIWIFGLCLRGIYYLFVGLLSCVWDVVQTRLIGDRTEPNVIHHRQSNPDPQNPREIDEEIRPTPPQVEPILEEGNIGDPSPIQQVRDIVGTTDDPSMPVLTVRVWILGTLFCLLFSFMDQFFSFRSAPLELSQITIKVVTLWIGKFMALILPKTVSLPGFRSRRFSLNPSPFNMKEHVLISIYANAGSNFGSSPAYSVGIATVIEDFYHREIPMLAVWSLVILTKTWAYGMAGLMRRVVVEPGRMWWPNSLAQVQFFRVMHEEGEGQRRKIFMWVMGCSFLWYLVPGYLVPTLSSISFVCLIFPKSIVAHQLGSGLRGLGLGSFTLDWSVVTSYQASPFTTPFSTVANVCVGFALHSYVALPIFYWWVDAFSAQRYPIFSSHLFTALGQIYDVTAVVNDKFELDVKKYDEQGKIYLSLFSTLSHGFAFATTAATLSHVALFHGRRRSAGDVHSRLMKEYRSIPTWWFIVLIFISISISMVLFTHVLEQVQMNGWGLVLVCSMSLLLFFFISIITATTNETPGINITTEYVTGIMYPGKPIANILFKSYGYMSIAQAISFLADFKLAHYMKIPPLALFLVQGVGSIVSTTVYFGTEWLVKKNVKDICQDSLPPDSPWTCPDDRVLYDSSVVWGLVGTSRMFGIHGMYYHMNWCFLVGFIAPFLVYGFHRIYPLKRWIPLINFPIIFGASAIMPPATALNFTSWIFVGIFNYYLLRRCGDWWKKHTYLFSTALEAGLGFMAVILFLTAGLANKRRSLWGSEGEHCGYASCPSASGITVDWCPSE